MVLSHALRRRDGLVAAVVLGLGVRLVLLLAGSGRQRFLFADSGSYLDVATSFPRGIWDPSAKVLPESLGRTPAYPALIWLVQGHEHLALIVLAQIVLAGAVSVWLAHTLAHRLAGPVAACAAAFVVALDPATVGHSLLVATETLTATLVLASLVALERVMATRRAAVDADRPGRAVRWAALAGLALAGTVLTRPNAFVLLLAATLLVAVAGPRGRRATLAAVLLAVASAPLGLWVLRNDHVAGTPILSTVTGQNVAGFGVAAVATEQGRLGGVAPDLATFNAATEPVAREVHLSPIQGDTFSVASDRTWRREGLDLMRTHPRGTAIVASRGLVRAVAAPGDSLALEQLPAGLARPLRLPSRAIAWAWLAALYGSAAVGALVLGRTRRGPELAALVGTVVLYLLSSVGPFLYVRFRVPVIGPLAVLAGIGLAALDERRRCGRDGDTAVHP